ncbi:hypothetical protein MMC30_001222 [Trapelia coarctata]|nr:hypothetical protein [Trapelia coarctata]
MAQNGQFDRHLSVASFSGRSFLSRTLARRDAGASESADDVRGPLGLTTLSTPLKQAVCDLVFVHGMGGGSRSSWTKSADASLFWPKEWLPQDTGFEDVRIHTFGYNSNWEKESSLNIHDFAKSLLGSIQDCPAILRGSNTPLIFVGHSMGGLVIKKAYILARQFHEFESLGRRVRAMIFLATPHRGADLAQTMTRILQMVPGNRPFVQDLNRNSLATQSINDEFPQHCKDLQLFSFYETLPMSYGVGKGLIVEKDLATLGYSNERTAYLNGNHRDICKYLSPADPNYLTVRNALASTIDSFRSEVVSYKRDLGHEQRRVLDNFLGTSDAPEDDLMGIDALRMEGSCEWILHKETFKRWRDSGETSLYWVSAKPATGKSVLSGFVINHLRDFNRDCCFYFFTYGNKGKTSISSFLRSIAWQMAYMHPEVLQIILEICEKDEQLGQADYRTIWRKLFLDGILRVRFERQQYWVIDALDECKSDSDLVPLLLKIIEISSIRIISTSRNKFESHRQAVSPRITVLSEEILAHDTRLDISLYLEANMEHLPSVDEEARQDMVTKILAKSAGCFLWVSLVLQELRQVHTSAEIRQVLEDVPSDMDELYTRILDSMSAAQYGKLLAKAILTWTVCSARPLTTHELYHALQLDIKDTIADIQKSIMASCGQLVHVDAQSRVHMVHQTARDFLLRPTTKSEFAVNRKAGHTRLALTCLLYLNGNEMEGPRQRKLSASSIAKQRCPFVDYACNSLFEHVAHVSSTDDDLLMALAKFLGSWNVLSWIEYLAQNSDLNRLIQTGKAFRNFLHRRSKHMSPFGKEVAILDSWSTDLARLVTKFGNYLSTSPSSIYYLIPPFCPPDTAPRKQFGTSPRGITVLGLSATTWDDCLSTIINPREQYTALTSSDQYFAVGTSSGKIIIYHSMTCQELRTLQHMESVRNLQFGATGDILASAGMKVVLIWDATSWEQLWKFDISQQCMSLAFTDDDRLLLGALKSNQLMIWNLTTGLASDTAEWTQDIEGQRVHAYRRPIAAAFCMEQGLLAIVYRGQDLLLWDIEKDEMYDTYSKSGAGGGRRDPGVTSLVFSAAPHASLLAAAYSDGDLVLFDTREGEIQEIALANAQTLACSPDGRTLASGDSAGTIQLFDFETLKLLYRMNSDEYGIKSLAFSGDSHRLLDIRGSQCRVWDPTVLVRQDIDEDTSDTVSISTAPQEITLEPSEDVILITSLAIHDNGEVFFCGKDDGSVWLYETKSGRQNQKLFSHAEGVAVISLLFDNDSHYLSSIDSSSRVMMHKLTNQQKDWHAGHAIFDHRAGVAVDQLLNNKGHTRMIVCSATTDSLFSIAASEGTEVATLAWKHRGPYRWESHPLDQDKLILISGNVVHLYEWLTLRRLTGSEGILLEGSILPELWIRSITPCFKGTVVATAFGETPGPHSRSKLLLWNTADFTVESRTIAPVPKYQYLADQVEFLIGGYGQRLVFLHSSGWVCSVDPQTPDFGYHIRHFLVPADWLSTNSELMVEITRKGDIVFVRRDEVAVIKRGLEASEQGPNSAPGKRPLLAAGRRPSVTVSKLALRKA